MEEQNELWQQRLAKLDELREQGFNPYANDFPVLHTAADVRAAHERMASIIEDSLVLTRGIDVGEMEPVSLERAATEAWAFVETGDASFAVTEDLVFVANESLLGNLFENLVRNAVEHGREDGPVTVRTGVLPTGDGF